MITAEHVDCLHAQEVRTHTAPLTLLLQAAAATGHGESDASSALRQYESFGALPRWASRYLAEQSGGAR